MKSRIWIAWIAVILAAVVLGSISAQTFFDRDKHAESFSPRHVISKLDPEVAKPSISYDATMDMLQKVGYSLPSDCNANLISDQGWNKIYWAISWKGHVYAKVDAFTGEIIGIDDYRNVSNEVPCETVSEENVATITLENMKRITDVPDGLGEPDVRTDDDGNFVLLWKQYINNVPVRGGFINARLDKCGNLVSFRKVWHGISVDVNPEITDKEAMDTARAEGLNLSDVLKKRVENADNVYTELVIGRPFNLLDRDKPIYGDYTLFWSVTFEDVQMTLKGPIISMVAIQVDAHSGEVVGMDYTK